MWRAVVERQCVGGQDSGYTTRLGEWLCDLHLPRCDLSHLLRVHLALLAAAHTDDGHRHRSAQEQQRKGGLQYRKGSLQQKKGVCSKDKGGLKGKKRGFHTRAKREESSRAACSQRRCRSLPHPADKLSTENAAIPPEADPLSRDAQTHTRSLKHTRTNARSLSFPLATSSQGTP